MAHLKSYLELKPHQHIAFVLKDPQKLFRAQKEVNRILGDVTPRQPNGYDLIETYKYLKENLNNLNNIPRRHLKRAPWVMFETASNDEAPLVENKNFLKSYLNAMLDQMVGSAITTLAIVFLKYYPVEKNYFNVLRLSILNLINRLKTPKGRVLKEKSQQYGFFADDGYKIFGALLADSLTPNEVLLDAGFKEDFIERAFIEAALKTALDQLSIRLINNNIEFHLIKKWTSFLVKTEGSKQFLRFTNLRVNIADSFLKPFISTHPPKSLLNLLRSFFIDVYSDPRLHQGEWHGVSDEALSVIHRWLVDTTLEDFFRIVREGSHRDVDADRMWSYREAFWKAYLNKGVITDAWVVLGETIAFTAKRYLKGQTKAYARYERGSGVKAVHATLIMKIDSLTITEWNHSGKYRIWFAEDSAPLFYQPRYTRLELTRAPDAEAAHYNAERGTWQTKLSSMIAEKTGILVSYREFMPQQ